MRQTPCEDIIVSRETDGVPTLLEVTVCSRLAAELSQPGELELREAPGSRAELRTWRCSVGRCLLIATLALVGGQ